jgi:hypothetical protein
MATAARPAKVIGMVPEEPVRGRPAAATVVVVAATVVVVEAATVTESTAVAVPLVPQLTVTVSLPEAVAGTVAEKLKLPVAFEVPDPIWAPSIDALTAEVAGAPEPLTVMVCPGAAVVGVSTALQPP